jgi:hypothetical protein
MLLSVIHVFDAWSIALPCIHALACSSHLGTLDAPREGRDVGAKPEDGVGGSIPRMEGPWSACLDGRHRQDGAS